jgi:hypothetical protein
MPALPSSKCSSQATCGRPAQLMHMSAGASCQLQLPCQPGPSAPFSAYLMVHRPAYLASQHPQHPRSAETISPPPHMLPPRESCPGRPAMHRHAHLWPPGGCPGTPCSARPHRAVPGAGSRSQHGRPSPARYTRCGSSRWPAPAGKARGAGEGREGKGAKEDRCPVPCCCAPLCGQVKGRVGTRGLLLLERSLLLLRTEGTATL